MDFYNNDKGRNIGLNYNVLTSNNIIENVVLLAVINGLLKYINSSGNLVYTNQ